MESSGAEIEEYSNRKEEKRKETKHRSQPISTGLLCLRLNMVTVPQQQRKETVDAYIYCVRETGQPKRETKMGEKL